MPNIILSTLNAKYIHASLGLRYLYANLKELQQETLLREFTIKGKAIDMVEEILSLKPKIVGFGVYIWNTEETLAVISQLKTLAPDIIIVLGGPEVSYETEQQPLIEFADYVLTGAADLSFYQLCKDILAEQKPDKKVLNSKPVKLAELELPYSHYSNDDLSHRLIYVEASRGCPFKCEFCLSSLDKTSYPFELQRFLDAMEDLYQRGARHFKFVDRTFNLKIKTTIAILEFFLERMSDDLFLHFEVIPDHLPEALKEALKQFPEGTLQFEVGIQTFNSEVQSHISRKQNNEKSKNNLTWLRDNTTAHIHADLIFGLPGETLETFADSFNQLYECRPHEIQMGILKRLKGSPIIRHTDSFDLRFNPLPPFNILQNNSVDFLTMQRVNRFARYWDMVANSGRFRTTLPLLLNTNPFEQFLILSDWFYEQTQQTHQLHLRRWFDLIAQAVESLHPEILEPVIFALKKDFDASNLKGRFEYNPQKNEMMDTSSSLNKRSIRQKRHLQ
ncbi:B12-binding domain-containing radical SAM protein [Pleionea sp. CnH1-48]|uniref:B12-binding domain-containing radical SAM protein n=1 Tax=Pleionea sp. CnH1-48 TaxID=2954494 RepID=UPI0020983671|nr:B12-binding domain-containing radical SAM protein [Pleionea sp. CnH1-48]MCO7222842.1 B12-binding domain-containing radical SAM protein [Pleionea sp. CnH1-48]